MRTSGFTTIFFILILILIYSRVTDIFSMIFWRNYYDTFLMNKQDGGDTYFIIIIIVIIILFTYNRLLYMFIIYYTCS